MTVALPTDVLSKIFSFLAELSLTAAVNGGDLELVKLLVAVDKSQYTAQHMDTAARYGHLEIVKLLHRASPAGCTKAAMDAAATRGHLEVVQFLHFNRTEECTGPAPCEALRRGHSTVARFFLKHSPTKVRNCMLIHAVYGGRRDVMSDFLQLRPLTKTAAAKEAALQHDRSASETIEILKLLFEMATDRTPSQALYHAARLGQLETVKYLVEQGEGFVRKAMDAAVGCRHVEILRHLLEVAPVELDTGVPTAWINEAAIRYDLATVTYLCEEFPDAICSSIVLATVAERGDLELIKCLHRPGRTESCGEALLRAAVNGFLAVVQYLVCDCEDVQLEVAAVASLEHGHFDVTRFLVEFRMERQGAERVRNGHVNSYLTDMVEILDRVYQHGPNERTAKALAVAARLGDLDVVQYLTERSIGDVNRVTIAAISHGHLPVVRCLIESIPVTQIQRRVQVNKSWMTEAARTDHLEILVYLHENVPGLVCLPAAMDHAASMGYLDIVQFLHTNRTEGCTTKAMDGAAMGNHFEMVRFLHAHRTEGCSKRAFEKSTERGLTEMIQLLLEITPSMCNVDKCIQLANEKEFVETAAVLEKFKTTIPGAAEQLFSV